MRRTPILALALAVLGFAVAGCGGGSSKGSFPTTTETTLGPTTEATTTSEVTGIASAANCRELAELGQKFSAAFTGAANSHDLKEEASLLKEFAAKTPAGIRADFELLADYMRKIADAVGNLKPGDTPDAQALAKLQKLATEIDQTKLGQASQNIAAWVQKNCKS